MDFLSIFTLEDVFLVAIGLVTVSIIRIYYDSYIERKKIKYLCRLIDIHNNIDEDEKEGILVISNNNKVILADSGVGRIFGINKEDIDIEYLNNIRIQLDDSNHTESNLMDIIINKNHLDSARILNSGKNLSVSTSLSKAYAPSIPYDSSCVVVFKNLNSTNKLREAADDLISNI